MLQMYCNDQFLRQVLRKQKSLYFSVRQEKKREILSAALPGNEISSQTIRPRVLTLHNTPNNAVVIADHEGEREWRWGKVFTFHPVWNSCRTSGKQSPWKFIVLLNPSLLNSSHGTLKWYPGNRLALHRDGNYISNYKIQCCPNNKYCAQEVPTQEGEFWPLLTGK